MPCTQGAQRTTSRLCRRRRLCPLCLCHCRLPHICRCHQLATAFFFAIPIVTTFSIPVVFGAALFCRCHIFPPPHFPAASFCCRWFCRRLFSSAVVLQSPLSFYCGIYCFSLKPFSSAAVFFCRHHNHHLLHGHSTTYAHANNRMLVTNYAIRRLMA